MPGYEACLAGHCSHAHRHSSASSDAGGESGAAGVEGFTLPGARREYAPDLRLEPLHVRASLTFALHAGDTDARLRVPAEVCTRVRCNAAGATTLVLNGVAFKDVAVKGQGVASRYDGERLTLVWAAPFALHEEREVTVSYVIDRPVSGLFLSVPDKQHPNRPVYAVTDEESERARYWLLCVDYPAVRTTLTFELIAHESYSTVANGLLQTTEALPNGMKKSTWHCEHRVPSYLVCLGVAAWDIVTPKAAAPVPIAYYALPGCGPAAALAYDPTPHIMNWMVGRLGVPFPFKAYRILTAPGIGGAMENITLTTFDQRFLVDAKSAEEWQQTVTEVNVHEMAHSYFGDAVVVRHFEHAWLKESWATYVEALYLEQNHPRADFEYDMWNNAHRYFAECERYMRPIVCRTYNNSFQLYDAHLYPGGAWRIHMLRHRLGDERFFAAVKAYLTAYMGKTVETDDFRKVLEAESGLNLTRYFDEFFYAPNYPRLTATLTYAMESGQLRLLVTQSRPAGEEPYEISLEVAVTERSGKRHEGTLHWGGGVAKEAFVTFALSSPPTVVEFDPNTKLLFSMEWAAPPGDDVLAATAQHAASVGARIGAIGALIKRGSPPALDAALAIALKEPHWGVRYQAARGFARLTSSARALKALASLLAHETHPHALHNIAALCGIRDHEIEEALISVLNRPHLPYRANARALEALGAQRNPAHLPRLLAAADDNGWQGIVRLGALQGLSKSGLPEALPLLAARVPYGGEAQELIRADVISAYGAYVAAFGERADVQRATERLLEAMRTHADNSLGRASVNAVHFAARALVALRAQHASGAIAAAKSGLAYQYHAALDTELINLRKATDDSVAALTKRVADLEARLRTLEERKTAN